LAQETAALASIPRCCARLAPMVLLAQLTASSAELSPTASTKW